MWTLPLAMTVVVGALAAVLLRQYRDRKRPYQLAWAISLATGTAAGIFYLVCMATSGSELAFRFYYICGALLIAPLLGLGSMVLLGRRTLLRVYGLVVAVGGVLGIIGIATAPLDRAQLAALSGSPGTTMITGVLPLVAIIVLNSLGTIAVIGVALSSAVGAARRLAPAIFVWGNVLIAVGTLIIAAAGSMARLGHGAGFWGTMLVGWVGIYVGVAVMAAHHPAAQPVQPATA